MTVMCTDHGRFLPRLYSGTRYAGKDDRILNQYCINVYSTCAIMCCVCVGDGVQNRTSYIIMTSCVLGMAFRTELVIIIIMTS